MAIAAGVQSLSHSSSVLAINSKFSPALPLHSCRLPSPFSQYFPLPLHQRLRKHSSSFSCCKHEGVPITIRMAAFALHCLSSSSSCPIGSLHQVRCKGMLKRAAIVTAFAAADSDQSQSSHEELGEGTIGCWEGEGESLPKRPSPEIKPRGVVQAQLQALREQDLATVFGFASPKNKAHTGPLSRFTEMIQGRAYNVMLGHSSAKVLSTLSVGPDRFQQRILIEGSNGKQAIFSWSLSRQDTEPFQDCWMTDSVHRDE